MTKLIAFLKSSPRLSREQVIEYYETRHVPLICSIMPGILDYRRNFLSEPVGEFDIVTEVTFADQAAFDTAMAAATAAMDKIAEDESNFLDNSVTKLVLADERRGFGRG